MDLTEFRRPDLVRKVLKDIWQMPGIDDHYPLKFMEVCGTHTMAIGQWGIRRLLPESISLISGPGCPVCVTPSSVIDELMRLENVTIATFGDLMRIPGTSGTLEDARARGVKIKTVYSPLEALELAKREETIFAGIGFETTIPGVAYSILQADRLDLDNFSVWSVFKLVPPALAALLSDKDIEIDGFILPGHVSVITGAEVYEFLPREHMVGGVVTGFEPLDIVIGIKSLLEQLSSPRIINQYNRVVSSEGNIEAKKAMSKVFSVTNTLWRGLGWIPESGLKIRSDYSRFDAAKKYGLDINDREEDSPCRCGDVLKGKIIPPNCPLFEKTCNPYNPYGPCMVSSEGSCGAYFKYER